MDTEQKKRSGPVRTSYTADVLSVIIEDEEESGQNKRCGAEMRSFLSSPYMAALASLFAVNGVLFPFAGFNWTLAVPVTVCFFMFAAAVGAAFYDARFKPAFDPRGLFYISMAVKVQKCIVYVAAGFFAVYTFFAFLGADILLGATGGFYDSLNALGLWNVPLFLGISFILYCAHRYLWRKGMFADNYRDAAELGLIFGKGAAEYAGLCIMLAAVRIFLYAVKPDKWTGAKYLPSSAAEFLDAYGIGGKSGAVGVIAVIFNVILLLYIAALAAMYFVKVKKFKKTKKSLDKQKKL